MATSLRSCSPGGSGCRGTGAPSTSSPRPRPAVCLPDCTSLSVRPSDGRISAVRPCTRWQRFSFVETCTVSAATAQRGLGDSVSGVAEAKLPPMPMNTDACPSRIARIASTVSRPCLRGLTMPNRRPARRGTTRASSPRCPSCGRPGRWSARAPGTRPAPGLADHAAHQQQVGHLVDRRDAVRVLGQPHRPAGDGALEAINICATRSICSRSARSPPPPCPDRLRGSAPRLLEAGGVPAMKSRSSTRARRRGRRPRAAAGPSPGTAPGRRRSGSAGTRRRSATPWPTTPCTFCGSLNRISPASGSGLIAMIFAPFAFAFSSADSIRGWLVPGFWPAMRMQVGVLEVVDGHRALADADRVDQRRARRLVAHVRAVRQVVRAEAAHQQLVEERGLVAGAAGGVEHAPRPGCPARCSSSAISANASSQPIGS